ncbi:MAG TPA: tRNA (adenosine(37)-N6)-threonylcarbamoyltransferase complex dimerization subunit type 1 TsaB [Ignavibacteria bacterium]|nr:tRNA (adenosine(37)-N6)-threonylcarbamoyltransferase complex dimerization subunit type 1 TsaB [Ignavibacteria bacterium]
MKILLIDCSSDSPEFAVAENNSILVNEKLDRDSNAESLIYNLNICLRNSSLSFNDVSCVSVSNGPGSFTGLRVGLAIAKGLCFANNLKLILLSSLDIIASSVNPPEDEKFICTIPSNVKSGEMYFSVYQSALGNVSRIADYGIDTEINLKNMNLKIFNSEKKSMSSQLKLSVSRIIENNFDDISNAEPFYLKEFIPLKSKNGK